MYVCVCEREKMCVFVNVCEKCLYVKMCVKKYIVKCVSVINMCLKSVKSISVNAT
jgi:hypothetical protein